MSTREPLEQRVPPPPDALTRLVNRLVARVARHWLLLVNLFLFLYLAVPTAAPILMQTGHETSARAIYTVYRLLCHELPERSYFLFGPQLVYSLETLKNDRVLPGESVLERPRYVGDAQHGYKIALCQRDLAIYGTILLAGLAFGTLRSRRKIAKLPIKIFLLFAIPIALDGFSQLVGLRESNWALRTLTGMIFGVGCAWLAHPHIEDAMRDALQSATQIRQNAGARL